MATTCLKVHVDIGVFGILCALWIVCYLDSLRWAFSWDVAIPSLILDQARVVVGVGRGLAGGGSLSRLPFNVFEGVHWLESVKLVARFRLRHRDMRGHQGRFHVKAV